MKVWIMCLLENLEQSNCNRQGRGSNLSKERPQGLALKSWVDVGQGCQLAILTIMERGRCQQLLGFNYNLSKQVSVSKSQHKHGQGQCW